MNSTTQLDLHPKILVPSMDVTINEYHFNSNLVFKGHCFVDNNMYAVNTNYKQKRNVTRSEEISAPNWIHCTSVNRLTNSQMVIMLVGAVAHVYL